MNSFLGSYDKDSWILDSVSERMNYCGYMIDNANKTRSFEYWDKNKMWFLRLFTINLTLVLMVIFSNIKVMI